MPLPPPPPLLLALHELSDKCPQNAQLVAGSIDPEKCYFRYKCTVLKQPLKHFPEDIYVVLNEADSPQVLSSWRPYVSSRGSCAQDLGIQVVNELGHTITFWRWKDIKSAEYLLKNNAHDFLPVLDWAKDVDSDGYIYMEGTLYTVNALRQLVPHYLVMREIWMFEFKNEAERQSLAEPAGPFRLVQIEDWERKGGCGFKVELVDDTEGEGIYWELVCATEHQKTMWMDIIQKRIGRYHADKEAKLIKTSGKPIKGGFKRVDRSGNEPESDEEENPELLELKEKRAKLGNAPKTGDRGVCMVKIDVKGIGEFSLLGDGGDAQRHARAILPR